MQAAAAELYVYKYVEVFGHLRMVDSTLCLMAFRIRPLTNYNQVHGRSDVKPINACPVNRLCAGNLILQPADILAGVTLLSLAYKPCVWQAFHHHLEVVHQHLMHSKGPLEEDRQKQQENSMQGTPMVMCTQQKLSSCKQIICY